MATAYSFESPERLLKRVQQLEDMELPSLPSFQHDLDYESASMSGGDTSQEELPRPMSKSISDVSIQSYPRITLTTKQPQRTPHPLRRAIVPSPTSFSQATRSPAESSATTTGSPFPPLLNTSSSGTPSPYVPTAARTSTPFTQQSRTRSNYTGMNETRSTVRPGHERTHSGAGELGNSTKSGREKWMTPGEMSGSFSASSVGDGELLLPELPTLGDEQSIRLNDLSTFSDQSDAGHRPGETPITHRLSSGNVLIQRPGRRSVPHALQTSQSGGENIPSSVTKSSPVSNHQNLLIPPQDRIPSLSRSEISGTDTSGAASTPEGPVRRVMVATPRSAGEVEFDLDEEEAEMWDQDQAGEEQTHDYQQSEGYPSLRELREETPSPLNYPSPRKIGATPFYSTPGMVRGNATATVTPMPVNALRDVTSSAQNSPSSIPFTPSPISMSSKFSDPSTPRAPLDDAERRKNHVLAVLSSTGVPNRVYRAAPRGTPHPLRRVSLAPTSESITEEGSPSAWHTNNTPLTVSRLSIDQTRTHTANDSFVSVTSSADLTSDRRATTTHNPRMSRANTSFPTILLPTGNASTSAGGSLKGLSEQRADGVKIHKHLNAMNKQLLESNADLAREAEGWRDEVERLRGILLDNGVEVEEVDVLGNISMGGEDEKMEALKRRFPNSPSGFGKVGEESGFSARFRSTSQEREGSTRDILDGMTPEQHAAVMQEMAERLESLEKGLDEKDALINELEIRLVDEGDRKKVEDLQARLDDAERARVEVHSEFALKTEQHAKQFGEICKGFEEQVEGLEKELKVKKGEVERLEGEKGRLEGLVNAGGVAEEREVELRKQVEALEMELDETTRALNLKSVELDQSRKLLDTITLQRDELDRRSEDAETKLQENEKRHIDEVEELRTQVEVAQKAQYAIEDDVGRQNDEMIELRQIADEQATELEKQYDEVETLSRRIQDLETELAETAEDDKRAEVELSGEVDRLQQLLDETNILLAEKETEISRLLSQASRSPIKPGDESVDSEIVKQLEDQLENAFREIGRLKHELNASPHRKTAIEVKDAKIKALEREKSVLADRLSAARNAVSTPTGVQAAASPFRATPFVHKAIASLRTPKTPGPLRDLSWLNTTIGDANEPVLRAQLDYLQNELINANDQLDNNFSRLEAAGLSGVALAEKLAAAEDRIAELEDELRGLAQRNKASLALVSAQRDENGREADVRMENALKVVHEQMASLKSDMGSERNRLQKHNERMKDLVSELRLKSQTEVDCFRKELERLREGSEAELRDAEAARVIAVRQRDLSKKELHASAARVRQLELDLASQRTAHEDLSRRFAKQAQSAITATDLASKTESIRSLQANLDLSKASNTQLRQDLQARDSRLRLTENRIRDLEQERAAVTADLEEFEKEMSGHKASSRQLGEALEHMRSQQGDKDKEIRRVEKELREASARIGALSKEVGVARARAAELDEWRSEHECGAISQALLDEQRTKYKAQSRDLATQIRYLKAKFTRESTFRNALALQKRYLLLLVGGMSLNEQATLKQIASMGFPVPEPPRPRRSFKAVGLVVLGLIRARNDAQRWRSEIEMKSGAVQAHNERKRISSR